MVGGLTESGAGRKTKGALQGAQEKLKETFGGSESEESSGEKDGGQGKERQPARRRSSRKEDQE
ncbi:hypothetical protein Acsp03_08440 [Actinomadura sp. NBRC 104412]|uniref:hypothetical protein n=1 Tax=Actinomadura sp. NBRC 104412 TaxID=3032203 RepID=UPI0024A59D5A|nr:hypothetical protein Acsp03_08440 [Actinomadura sp. NBRC 104412]